jgi:hypothetical protein
VFDLVESICAHSRKRTLKGIIVHLDNAYPHNSRKSTECVEQVRARRVTHPDYSSDLAPNDFFLFRYEKSKLSDHAIRNGENLIYEIRSTFEEIPKIIHISVSISLVKWLKWVIKNDRDYFHSWAENCRFWFRNEWEKAIELIFWTLYIWRKRGFVMIIHDLSYERIWTLWG